VKSGTRSVSVFRAGVRGPVPGRQVPAHVGPSHVIDAEVFMVPNATISLRAIAPTLSRTAPVCSACSHHIPILNLGKISAHACYTESAGSRLALRS
jgi:hypothetical protein